MTTRDNTLPAEPDGGNEEVKDLEYYKMHPEEMPTDIEGIEALAVGIDGETTIDLRPGNAEQDLGDEVTLGGDMPSNVKPPEPKAPETPAAEILPEKPDAPKEEEPAPILARDGKSTIPYAQLESARKQEREAREELTAAKAELETLKSVKPAPATVPTETDLARAEPVEIEAPDFKALREEFPEAVIDTMEASHKAQVAANAEVARLRKEIDDQRDALAEEEAAEQADMDLEVRDAIDANKTLNDWETNHPELWGKALKVDLFLRTQTDGEWDGKPFNERFDKVVEMVQAQVGPGEGAPTSDPPAAPDIKAQAEAKLRDAEAQAPTSMSSIPGGSAPPQNEQQSLEQTSETQLAAKFEKMTQAQQDDYLNSLAV